MPIYDDYAQKATTLFMQLLLCQLTLISGYREVIGHLL